MYYARGRNTSFVTEYEGISTIYVQKDVKCPLIGNQRNTPTLQRGFSEKYRGHSKKW